MNAGGSAPTPPAPHPTLIPLPDELRGEQTLLRPLRPDDAEAVFSAIDESREHLRPWMDWVDRHRTVADTHDYCVRCAARWLLRSDLTFGIFDPGDGRCLGGTGLHNPNWDARRFEIGYWLRPSATGRGHATEAVRLVVALAFETLAARRLELRCDARNDASRRVAQRAGFVFEGRLRNAFSAPDGLLTDALVFALVPSDLAERGGSSPTT